MKIMNKKRFALTALAFFVIALGTTVIWTEKALSGKTFGPENPASLANVIVVAKSMGDFDSIQAAIDSITAASDANHYIINVMPGTYNESITMKPYVDVVGSGKETTKITSSDYVTLQGANASTIENIWIDNWAPDDESAAVWNDGISMTIDNAKITKAVAPVSSYYYYGVYNTNGAKVTISNCDITVINASYSGRGALGVVAANGSDVTISNCKITVDSTDALDGFWNVGVKSWKSNKVTVRDSEISVVGAAYNSGFEASGAGIVSNTRVEAIATANTVNNTVFAVSGSSEDFNVINSEIIATSSASQTNCAVTSGNFGSSLINGPICGAPKIVNSWDGNFNPIPNQ